MLVKLKKAGIFISIHLEKNIQAYCIGESDISKSNKCIHFHSRWVLYRKVGWPRDVMLCLFVSKVYDLGK